MLRLLIIVGFVFWTFCFQQSSAQFSPLTLLGYNQDVIAESGPSPFATTTAALDAAGSNKVMYTPAFANFAGITGGVSTLITVGPDIYSLGNGNTSANNALFIFKGQTKSLFPFGNTTLSKLRLVCFSTEGPSNINVDINFSDGSITNYISNYLLPDWFFGTTNIIAQGFGRVSRTATGPWPADGLPSNPKIYYVEITLNCADKLKLISGINISNVSPSGNAPFPNTVVLGVSAISSASQVTSSIVPSDCSGSNGSISLNVSGGGSPYTFVWNTIPVQTGPIATGLNPGTYTCVISDALGCTSTVYTGIVSLNNNSAINATATPSAICAGGDVQLNGNVTSGALTSFTWNPGNLTGVSVTINPVITTTYTVTGTNVIGCTATAQVTVIVNPSLVSAVSSTSICSGGRATLIVVLPVPGYTYEWYDALTGGSLVNTGINFLTPPLFATTNYYVEGISPLGCRNSTRMTGTVTVNPLPPAATATPVTVCPGTNVTLSVLNPQTGYTYLWTDVPLGGILLGTGTTFLVNNVSVSKTYYIETVNNFLCSSATRGAVAINVLPPLSSPAVVVNSVTSSTISFRWNSVPGAIGYEVSTNGGASFQTPSSGTNGTTHTINGLARNITVNLIVRAIGAQACETSIASVSVSGTTLSTNEIFVPNVFTPNGDGKNDVLKVYGNYTKSIEFRIFNQWGQLIFTSSDISVGWPGTSFGTMQPVGVYAYTLKAVLTDGTIINKKGSVNLIR